MDKRLAKHIVRDQRLGFQDRIDQLTALSQVGDNPEKIQIAASERHEQRRKSLQEDGFSLIAVDEEE